MTRFTRIVQNRAVMGGPLCVRGQRVTASMLVGQVGCRTHH